ncbi:MAG: type II toxin-antitoxin system VapC family toxin [Candidatus Daviesbacteria bacterium]|nr:type II toxin-antitoxin system VapC family toxin [Candidatus Daviesbacteria bacterium]
MAKVFLDTNYFIDAIHRRPEKQILDRLLGHIIYISTLSFHIYCYSFKIKVPDQKVISQKDKFQLTDFSGNLLEKALNGPTKDLEDNIQLHSAAEADCDLFLTNDAKLLKLKSFGKTEVKSAV